MKKNTLRIEPRVTRSIAEVFAEQVAPFWECSIGEEPEITKEGLLIPARRSLTAKQMLGVGRDRVEFEELKPAKRLQPTKLRDKNGRIVTVMTETSDPSYRLAWKRPDTLLRRGKPDTFGEGKGTSFKRITSRTKERTTITEVKVNPDAQINITGTGPIYDDSADLGLPPGSDYHKP